MILAQVYGFRPVAANRQVDAGDEASEAARHYPASDACFRGRHQHRGAGDEIERDVEIKAVAQSERR